MLLLALGALVQANGTIRGARSLALSPDGTQIAFTYQGDVWVVSAKGGQARQVTNHIEMDDNPVWSPDGKRIAFASNRTGNWDVFIAPLEGGRTERLTYFSGSDVPNDWTADGRILIAGSRDKAEGGIYAIEVATGRIHELLLDMMSVGSPKMSNDGTTLLYTRFGFPWTRPRYHGSAASQLHTLDLGTKQRSPVRTTDFQHLWPHFGPDAGTVYAVSADDQTPSSSYVGKSIGKVVDSARRTPNVYAFPVRSRGVNPRGERLTEFVGGSVRFLTAAKRTPLLAFEYEGDVYTMTPGQPAAKIGIVATLDDKVTYDERLVLTTGAAQASLDAKGENVVFQVRGELWSVPVKKGKGPNKDDATQLTDWPGVDANPLVHPRAGKAFFTSDREGSERLYVLDLATKEVTPVSQRDSDVANVKLTPDGQNVSFFITGAEGGLYTYPVDGGSVVRVFAMPGQYRFGSQSEYAWSPDGRFVAYVNNANGVTTNIHIYDTRENKDTNITRLNASHRSPEWSADGKFLYFASDRDGDGMYRVALKRRSFRDPDYDLKYEKPKDSVTVEIEFEDIEDRITRFGSQTGVGAITFDAENGDVLFLQGGDITKVGYDGEGVTKFTSGGGIGAFSISLDTKNLVYVQNGTISIMNHRAGNRPVTRVDFRADWTRDVRLERKAAFYEFWREYNRSFYDANFHGRDWLAIRKRYEPLLEAVAHRNEMATLLNMMIGELEASHTEASAAPGNPSGASTAHPGFTIDYSHAGPGLKIASVPKRTPGAYKDTELKPGEYVMSINGVAVAPNERAYDEALKNQGGRVITLKVNSTPTLDGAREVKYEALGGGEFGNIHYRNQIEQRRRYVEEKSGGRLTYVHIAGMGGPNFDRFNREIWEYGIGKDGAVIDVRNNGGGNISDRIIDILERVPHSIYASRDGVALPAPTQAWNKPIVVMQNERSFSNAEMFPYAMQQLRLATTIGMPTPGYVIWTYGLRLVDGTGARMPTSGVYRLDGSPLENMGQQPNIRVDITPAEYFSGKDPQLDRAIEELLKKLPRK